MLLREEWVSLPVPLVYPTRKLPLPSVGAGVETRHNPFITWGVAGIDERDENSFKSFCQLRDIFFFFQHALHFPHISED